MNHIKDNSEKPKDDYTLYFIIFNALTYNLQNVLVFHKVATSRDQIWNQSIITGIYVVLEFGQ